MLHIAALHKALRCAVPFMYFILKLVQKNYVAFIVAWNILETLMLQGRCYTWWCCIKRCVAPFRLGISQACSEELCSINCCMEHIGNAHATR